MEQKVKVGKHEYTIKDQPIKDNDLVYNIFSKTVDRCLYVTSDGRMCVEFDGGFRAAFSTKNFRVAIKNKHNG